MTRLFGEGFRTWWLPLSLTLLSALAACYFGFLHFDVGGALHFVQYYGYWFIAAAFFLLIYHTFVLVREEGSGFQGLWKSRQFYLAAGYVLLISVIMLTSQPDYFKVVMDEPALTATSYSMHHNREAVATMRGYELEGSFHHLGGVVDKRPLFFPFMMSLLHDLTGYRPYQGIYFNALLTPVFLGLVFLFGYRVEHRWGGYLAVALWATVPLLPMVATSGGFDLLNLVMLALTSLSAYLYLQFPTARRLNILILLTVLLAQTRYESVLFVFPVGLLILYSWWRERRILLPWTAVLVPLLLIIYPLQRKVTNAYEGFWQMQDGDATPFSVSYVAENLSHAMAYFFHTGMELPNSLLLSVLFFLAAGVLLLGCYRKRIANSSATETNFKLVAIGFGSVIVFSFLLLMAYHWGQLDDIIATRLVLPVLFLQMIVVMTAYGRMSHRRLIGMGLASLVFAFFVFKTRPTCAQTDFLPWGIAQQKVEWLMKMSEEYQDRQVLIVTGHHLAALIQGVSAIRIEDALAARAKIDLHMRMGTFSEVYVVMIRPTQIVDRSKYADLEKAGEDNEALKQAFVMRKVEERQLNAAAYITLMQVKEVNLQAEERLHLDAGGTTVSYTGRMDYSAPDLIDAFITTLPK